MGFSRQEYWTGLPFPSPEDLPIPGIELRSPRIIGRHFTVWATRDRVEFTLISRPDIPGSYAILFFAASYFIFIPWHIHNWASFPLRPSHFILFGALSRSLLFPCSILDTFQPGGLIFCCHTFWLLIQFMRFPWQVYWGGLPFPSPVDHVLSELSTVTHPSWVVLHSMVHSFT